MTFTLHFVCAVPKDVESMKDRRVVFFLLLLRRVPALALCGLYEVP